MAKFVQAWAVGFVLCFANLSHADFIHIRNNGFEYNSRQIHYMGANFWYGMNLGSVGPGGDRARLIRELDRLRAMGVTNLRILAGSEGPDTEPWRIVPALQKSPGVYDQNLIQGLDFLLDEMKKRNLKAVVMLTNFWNWSGGMTQYRKWAGAGNIPYPPPQPGGDWTSYRAYASRFYSDTAAQSLLNNFVRFILSRKNSISGVNYKDDPTIMAWELANEPSVIGDVQNYGRWIDSESTFIKSLDSNHMVTTGSEGHPPFSEIDLARDHRYRNIDYVTIHLWVQNWGWYDPARTSTYPEAVNYMREYLSSMITQAKPLHKPLVLEEFGLARDNGNLDRQSAITYKDNYYRAVFDEVLKAARAGEAVAGVNFWAWGGEGIPHQPQVGWWRPGDPFTGEPAGERQGWYSVFDSDFSTIRVISEFAIKLGAL